MRPSDGFLRFLLLLHSILYFIIVLFPRWFINVTVIFMASAIEFSCGVRNWRPSDIVMSMIH